MYFSHIFRSSNGSSSGRGAGTGAVVSRSPSEQHLPTVDLIPGDVFNGIAMREAQTRPVREQDVLIRGQEIKVYNDQYQRFYVPERVPSIYLGRDRTPGLENDTTVANRHAVISSGCITQLDGHASTTIDRRRLQVSDVASINRQQVLGIGRHAQYTYNVDALILVPVGGHQEEAQYDLPPLLSQQQRVRQLRDLAESYRSNSQIPGDENALQADQYHLMARELPLIESLPDYPDSPPSSIPYPLASPDRDVQARLARIQPPGLDLTDIRPVMPPDSPPVRPPSNHQDWLRGQRPRRP